MTETETPLAQWQVEANRANFIRKRAEKMSRFAARSPCLSFDKYLEFAEKELTRQAKWKELPAYYDTPYGADGVCPEDWDEFYEMEREIERKMINMGQAEYEKWARVTEVEDSETSAYQARRNREVYNSLQHHRYQVRRHSGRTTKQQREHERSGNYPW